MEPERDLVDQQNTSQCGCFLSFAHSTGTSLLFLCKCHLQKDERSEAQKLKRAARDAYEDEWKQIKIRHDHAVSAWKTECARLKVAVTQPRDL